MIRAAKTIRSLLGPLLMALSALVGFGLAAMAFLSSLQNSLAAG